jgi:hypothetical protein
MHIRTIKNSFGLDVVIDVTEDSNVPETNAFDWIDIDGTAVIGDYYYNGQIINDASPNYNLIADVLQSHNEANRVQYEEQVAQHTDAEVVVEDHTPVPIPPIVFPEVIDFTQDPSYFPEFGGPPPVAREYTREEIPSTQENLDIHANSIIHMSILHDRLKSNVGLTKLPHRVDFSPPIEYNDGAIQMKVFYPDETFEEYVTYIEGNLNFTKQLVQRIKDDLEQ